MRLLNYSFLLFFLAAAAVIALSFGDLMAAGNQPVDPVRISIHKNSSGGINPGVVTVASGRSIVWRNKNPEPVKIIFTDDVGLACKPPRHFYADLRGHYESLKIPHNGFAEICFQELGEYAYEARRTVRKNFKEPVEMICTGKIIVTE